VVLLVDEAHAMPLETLEEIRLLSNLESSRNKLLQIVLFGQPELNENLNISQMRQLKERVTHSFTLAPLVRTDVREYLDFRMRAAGYHGPEIFNAAALKLIANASEGLTRRINILADKALLAAFAENSHAVEAKHAKAAIRDSEFKMKNNFTHRYALALFSLVVGLVIGWGFQNQTSTPHVSSGVIQPIARKPVVEPIQAGSDVQAVIPVTASSNDVSAVQATDTMKTAAIETTHVPAATEPVKITAQSVPSETQKSLLDQRLEKTRTLLTNNPNDSFLIQLMLVEPENIDSLKKFLNRAVDLGELNRVYVYKTSIKNKPKWGVIYGLYSSRSEAKTAMTKLPREFKTDAPILRTVKGIKDEIGRAHGTETSLRSH
jgi:hypothetical protein